MKYNKEAAEHLYRAARMYELSGAEHLSDPDFVTRECNGIGADWMPDAATILCTKLNSVMEVPAAIHDAMYAKGIQRDAADLEFLSNTIKVIQHEYAWWRPKRYILMRRAMRYYTYLVMFGGKAWEEARRKHNGQR
jgi:hypothetical protein